MEFEEYVAARGRALERYAYVLTGDAQRAQDLVQTALVKAYRRWARIGRTEQHRAQPRQPRRAAPADRPGARPPPRGAVMPELDDVLPAALHELAAEAPHDLDLAARVRRRARRGALVAGGAAGLAAVLAVVTVVALATWGGGRTASPPASPDGAVTVPPACSGAVVRGVLPEWARDGFTDPRPVMPYVRSASGDVVAILFGDPLTSPPRPGLSNKILWVWRPSSAVRPGIHLSARLDGTGPVVTSGLPAPFGPSTVDLPSPGCWRLTIAWSGGQDTVDLRYAPRS